jgi:hypothetical protein
MSSTGYAAGLAQGRTQSLFGRVMGLVALTLGCATLGVYLARNLGGAEWFVAWLAALGCLVASTSPTRGYSRANRSRSRRCQGACAR